VLGGLIGYFVVGPWESLFLGSETNDVLKHTTVPVLVVR
jgi:nucleotide-binding universal stress UspA family protein